MTQRYYRCLASQLKEMGFLGTTIKTHCYLLPRGEEWISQDMGSRFTTLTGCLAIFSYQFQGFQGRFQRNIATFQGFQI